jgi:hypothetical protein
MQSPVIRSRSVFIRNPRVGKQEKFDVVVAVSRRKEGDSSRDTVERAAEEAIKEFSAIFEQLVVSGKIPFRNQPQELVESGSQDRSARSIPVPVITGKPALSGQR